MQPAEQIAKIDHLKTGGTLLNQKFLPDFLKSEKGITSPVQLIHSYFKMDGHHIQFNVVDKETLQKAQEHPEAGAPGRLPGSYRAGGRVFRLFCGSHPGTSGGDHSSNSP